MKVIEELWEWLLINLIMPFLIPFLFVFLLRFIVVINSDVLYIFSILWFKGVYIFLGITLFLSVFQDYRDAKVVFKPMLFVIFFVHLLIIGFLFISSLDLISNNAVTFESNTCSGVFVSISSILIAIYTKYKVITHKINRLYR